MTQCAMMLMQVVCMVKEREQNPGQTSTEFLK